VAAVCERREVVLSGQDEPVILIARLMAYGLRALPATVTAPTIRLLARLPPPNFESDLATRCFGVEK
jgi:hypothetical protein